MTTFTLVVALLAAVVATVAMMIARVQLARTRRLVGQIRHSAPRQRIPHASVCTRVVYLADTAGSAGVRPSAACALPQGHHGRHLIDPRDVRQSDLVMPPF